ncbi:MAG: sodium:solute symporter family protein [Lachnospiraceae bacterium]|nr:sodium:solute symporter family protein [Lachnospiraceae bacterium]
MNYSFLIALLLFLLIFVIISVLDSKKVSSFKDYAVAGKKQTTFTVVMTTLATVIGASATIGLTDTVNQIGFPGVWWLVFGAIGLILQSLLLSEKIRETNADTLPHMTNIMFGREAEILLSLIIVISWIGVIAGQLVAMNSLIIFATGKNNQIIFAIVSCIIILYTIFGGQLSVVKTDKIQLLIVISGLIICLVFLYVTKSENNADIINNIELINSNYTPVNMVTQLFIIGGVYFLGPDILSRNFVSEDKKTAKKAAMLSGILLVIITLVITFIGMWVRFNVTADELGDNKALMYVIGHLPKGISIIMIFGLLSAILSSTDTCLINASSILAKDILKREDVLSVRICVVVLGLISTIFAISGNGNIISLLSGAYSIYTPGIIFPLLIAILCYKKRKINKIMWLSAVLLGGICGIAGTYFGTSLIKAGVNATVISNLSLIGMGISLIFSLLSIREKITGPSGDKQ